MKPTPPPITAHRLARLTAWGKLWLQGFAAVLLVLLDAEPTRARRQLAAMARFVSALVFLHVAVRVRPPQRRSWRGRVKRAGLMRAVKGGHLRASLRARDPVARFFAILSAMRYLEAHVARLAKRLARGLTRLRAIPPAHEHDAAALAAGVLAAVAADTS